MSRRYLFPVLLLAFSTHIVLSEQKTDGSLEDNAWATAQHQHPPRSFAPDSHVSLGRPYIWKRGRDHG